MTAPTFIQEAETAWTSTTGTRVTGTFTVAVSDILVAFWACEGPTKAVSISNSGTAFAWTSRQEVNVASYTRVRVYTTIASAAQSMTVTFTTTGGSAEAHGGNVLTFRNATAVGASSKTNTTGAPTLNLTTTQADSAVVVISADWNAVDGASRTWRANAGTLTEQTYFRDSARYTVFGGYHATAGAIGTYAVGLSLPTGQQYSIVAVEVQGVASGGGKVTKNTRAYPLGIQRGWSRRQGLLR